MLGPDFRPVGDPYREIHHLAQFGHVASSVAKREQCLTRALGDGRGVGAVPPEKLLGQRHDVLGPLDQGRQRDHLIADLGDRGDQSFAAFAGFRGFARGQDDAGVGERPADASLVSREEGAEQLLDRWQKFVGAAQDQGAAVSELNTTTAVIPGGQTPSEILAEDEFGRLPGREVAAVDGDERAGGSLRIVVNQPGGEGFSGAVFTENQNRSR